MALCEVFGVSITSHYPSTGNTYIEAVMNVELHPRSKIADAADMINLLWSRESDLDRRPGCPFVPNHIVPIFIIPKCTKVKLAPKIKVQSKIQFGTFIPAKQSAFSAKPEDQDKQKEPKINLEIKKEQLHHSIPVETYSQSSSEIHFSNKTTEDTIKLINDIALFYETADQLSDRTR